jgi:hypothetical protein
LAADPSIKPNAIEIVDFCEVTDFKMSYLEIQKIAENYKKPQSVQSIYATLFLCKSTVAFGIGRMLQTFHEIVNPEHRIFVVKTDSELEGQLSRLQKEIENPISPPHRLESSRYSDKQQ